MKDFKMDIPEKVLTVLNTLQSSGHNAYICGGAVRDTILDKDPTDWDITTSATLEQLKAILSLFHIISTGEQHGTVTVRTGTVHIEVSAYRSVGEDKKSPIEDVKHRDLTINGLLYNPTEGLLDYVGGVEDIRTKTIRCIGNPDKRYEEDRLRMMRAVRLSTQLDFTIERETFQAICRNAGSITFAAPERIRDEFMKVLLHDRVIFGLDLMEATGLTRYVLPELHHCVGFTQHNPHHMYDVYGHLKRTAAAVPAVPTLRLAALLHDIGKPKTFTLDDKRVGHFYGHDVASADMVSGILRRLKFDIYTIDTVKVLVRAHMSRFPHVRESTVKKLMQRVGLDNIPSLLLLQRADITASTPPHDFTLLDNLSAEIEKVLTAKEPFRISDLAINGKDLIGLGIPPGPVIGTALRNALDLVMQYPKLNAKENLLIWAGMYL